MQSGNVVWQKSFHTLIVKTTVHQQIQPQVIKDIEIKYSIQLSKQNTMVLYPSVTILLAKCRVEL